MNTKGLLQIFLKTGQIYISDEPACVNTILGSCISVTMFNSVNKISAICHAFLPNARGSRSYKYVDNSIIQMIKEFKKRGIAPDEIDAKLFGGAELLFPKNSSCRLITVGRQNIYSAHETLKKFNLKLINSDIGGDRGRKILFYTNTGEVYLKRQGKIDIEKQPISFLIDEKLGYSK